MGTTNVIQTIEYSQEYDESYLNSLIDKAKDSWADVEDVYDREEIENIDKIVEWEKQFWMEHGLEDKITELELNERD